MMPVSAEAVLAEILRLDVFLRQIGCEPSPDDRAAALALATELVASGRDKNLPPLLRALVFLPFLHSDELIDRERAVALFAGLRRETQDVAFEQAYEVAAARRDALAAMSMSALRSGGPRNDSDPGCPTSPRPRG